LQAQKKKRSKKQTTEGGRNWGNISDSFFGGSIGSVAVAKSDKNVLYAGGGEKTVRGNVSSGYGIWKSTDSGETWKEISKNEGFPEGTLGISG